MFVLNAMLGTVMVHPDWDSVIQWYLKYLAFSLGIVLTYHFADVLIATKMFEGYGYG